MDKWFVTRRKVEKSRSRVTESIGQERVNDALAARQQTRLENGRLGPAGMEEGISDWEARQD